MSNPVELRFTHMGAEEASAAIERLAGTVGATAKRIEQSSQATLANNKALSAGTKAVAANARVQATGTRAMQRQARATNEATSKLKAFDSGMLGSVRSMNTAARASRGLSKETRNAGRSMGMAVNEITEMSLGFAALSPKARQVTTGLAMMGNSAVTMGASMGPVGVAVAALTTGLPFLITELADTGGQAESTAAAFDKLTGSVDASISALRRSREQGALLARLKSGANTGSSHTELAGFAQNLSTQRGDLESQFAEQFGISLADVNFSAQRGASGLQTLIDRRVGFGDMRAARDQVDEIVALAERERNARAEASEALEDYNAGIQEWADDSPARLAEEENNSTSRTRRRGGRSERRSGEAGRKAAARRESAAAARAAELEWQQTILGLRRDEADSVERMLEMEMQRLGIEEQRADKLAAIAAEQKSAAEEAEEFQRLSEAKMGRIEAEDKLLDEASQAETDRANKKKQEMQVAGEIAERTGVVVLDALKDGPAAALDAFAEAFAEEMLLMSLKEAAFAIASLASFDYTGAAGHAASAAAFGAAAAAAGGVAAAIDTSPSVAASGPAPIDTGRPANDNGGDNAAPTTIIQFNAPTSEAQIGGQYERAIRESRRRTGRRAS